MIEAGQTYQSAVGHRVHVTAVCGEQVYYSDDYGLHFHKNARHFAGIYISTAAYYQLKGEPEKANFAQG
jgi:hypothetical protein